MTREVSSRDFKKKLKYLNYGVNNNKGNLHYSSRCMAHFCFTYNMLALLDEQLQVGGRGLVGEVRKQFRVGIWMWNHENQAEAL